MNAFEEKKAAGTQKEGKFAVIDQRKGNICYLNII